MGNNKFCRQHKLSATYNLQQKPHNIVRAMHFIDMKTVIESKNHKQSIPFIINKKLNRVSLKPKSQVEAERNQKHRYQKYNPF